MIVQFGTGTPVGADNTRTEQPNSGSNLPPQGSQSRNLLMPVQRQEPGCGMCATEREYSTQEAAELLGIASRTTIWEAYKNGDIRGRQQGKRGTIKIPHSALVEYARKYNYPLPPEPNDP